MPQLILIKHARPLMDPAVPSHAWNLSDHGRLDAERLARLLQPRAIDVLLSSEEPKAKETAAVIAKTLHLSASTTHAGLNEHDRSNVPVMPTREFVASIALFFKKPAQLVLGRESADEAARRFAATLDRLMREHQDETVAVVTHGTVLALYASPLIGEEPFQLWRRLGLPSFVVLDWPSRRVVEVVDRIGATV